MSANEADPVDVAEQAQPLVPEESEEAPRSEEYEADEGDLAEQSRVVPEEPEDEA